MGSEEPEQESGLSPAKVEALRALLLTERARLHGAVDDEEATAIPDFEVGDIEDKAAEEHRRTTARLRQGHHTARLDEVKAALSRMDDGLYGLCEETGEPIPFGRLKLQPTARFTVEALEQREEDAARAKVVDRGDSDDAY